HKSIELDTTQRDIDYGNLLLIRDTARLMEEVIIQAVAPVTMNGDTLEINPKAFKLASYAVVEDMLLRDALSDDFEVQLLQNRKQLTSLNRYYQQLLELLSTLASCPFPSVDKESRHLFGYLKNRVEIYHMEVQKLKEQLESLRDHYQLMHNEHQEEAVRFLTIATSVFMPLTLLTGWYGMNFSTMPELYWKYGYLVVILVAILILAVELFLFKKKKWL
ncbi:MAG TPA: CorA family divalent cation transporter, partial [Clostridiales bacterium]|nr:CorA family divalent cation transporter [Clostridiales bacterium]